jgi:hypothetical protein
MNSTINTLPLPIREQLDTEVKETEDGRTVIDTGAGDDKVKVTQAEDGTVTITANGEELWSGTAEEFEKVKLVTGAGADRVYNEVDGANIHTGKGRDHVASFGDDVNIFLGLDGARDRAISVGEGGHVIGGKKDRVIDFDRGPQWKG